MLDQNLKDQIQYAYKRMKHGRIKGFLLCWVIYVFMGGIVSLFLGNPFPHKESVFFFSIWDSGWIYTWADTRPYLLVIFTAAGMVLSSIGLSVMILRDLAKIDQVILQQCDAAIYLEAMEYGVAYGKSLKCKGFQTSVFMMMQQRLATALIANGKLEESRQFLTEEWIGKKSSRLYKKIVMNLDLVEAYYHGDAGKFNELFQNADFAFKKNKLFAAEQMFLEEKYEQAAAFLKTYKAKNPYNEVLRQYLLGMCFDKTGEKQMAEDCIQYVLARGNTMPCRKRAQEWILTNVPKV